MDRLTDEERAEIRRYRRRGLAAPGDDIHVDGISMFTVPREEHRDLDASERTPEPAP